MHKHLELTKSEIQICKLICKGFTQKHIAKITKRAIKTINNHTNHIYIKLAKHGVKNAASLGVFCVQNDIINYDYDKKEKEIKAKV
jgi:DNA-binding NarL/FixJ family response regulator